MFSSSLSPLKADSKFSMIIDSLFRSVLGKSGMKLARSTTGCPFCVDCLTNSSFASFKTLPNVSIGTDFPTSSFAL